MFHRCPHEAAARNPELLGEVARITRLLHQRDIGGQPMDHFLPVVQ